MPTGLRSTFSIVFTAFILLLFTSLELHATPVKTLTAPEVKNMISQGDVVLVNTLSSIEFEIQHIPGSINIPVTHMKNTTKLPKGKNTPIIFYCMGVR